VSGACAGDLGSRRPAVAVNKRVAGLVLGFQWVGAGVGHRMPKLSAMAWDWIGGG
jgi:hypothetical protein